MAYITIKTNTDEHWRYLRGVAAWPHVPKGRS